MLRFVTIKKFCAETGRSEREVRNKIVAGAWRMDEIFVKAPDGRLLVDVSGYEDWLERNAQENASTCSDI